MLIDADVVDMPKASMLLRLRQGNLVVRVVVVKLPLSVFCVKLGMWEVERLLRCGIANRD